MFSNPPFSRREFLWRSGGGFGALALSQMLSVLGSSSSAHHRPKAKRVIQLFMNGGVSQMDTFDYKPALEKLHGEKFDPGSAVEAATSVPGKVMKSPFAFKQHGECGRWVSSAFPYMAECVDDLAFLMAMTSKTNVHGPGSYMMNTGFLLPGFPCMGSWISYALGTLSEDLPSFVVLPDVRGLPYNQRANFSAGFLPAKHQGTVINAGAAPPVPDLFADKKHAFATGDADRDTMSLLQKVNRRHAMEHPGDTRLEARIAACELAARMQLSAPEAFDISRESDLTRRLYGLDNKVTEDFGRRCLLARRLVERGTRIVQVWSGPQGATQNWDNHASIEKELPPIAASVDQPIAALLGDLKARGLLADTLVVWTTEFGCTPFAQNGVGRDHNGGTFVSWMAGAGIKPGVAYGRSDDLGYKAAQGVTYCYDFHATILHLMGIDHTKLIYRTGGIDRRLTDVHGEVVREILV